MYFFIISSCVFILTIAVIILVIEKNYWLVPAVIITAGLILLTALQFLRSSDCDRVQLARQRTLAVCVEQTLDGVKFQFPRYWVEYEGSVKMANSQMNLPGYKRGAKRRVKTWNERQVEVFTASEFHHYCYRFQCKSPCEAGLLGQPFLSPQYGLPTCRFHGSTPECGVCGTTFSRHSITEAKVLGPHMRQKAEKVLLSEEERKARAAIGRTMDKKRRKTPGGEIRSRSRASAKHPAFP